jgi:hypothetical protein
MSAREIKEFRCQFPWIATFPESRWKEVTAAVLDVLGL